MRFLFLVAAILNLSSAAIAQTYDTVILNGRVMDPQTGFDQIANVGISAGWIVKITEDSIEGREAIEATGHVVAPGFIDTHFHALDGLSSKASLRDGVTTGMDMELGAMNVADWYAHPEKQTLAHKYSSSPRNRKSRGACGTSACYH